MSDADHSSTNTVAITNFDRVDDRDPRELTPGETAAGYQQPRDAVTTPYYAIFRADGYVGWNIGRHTKSPKIEMLFVTADGERILTDLHRATETDDEHEFAGTYPVVRQEPRNAGAETVNKNVEGYRELAHDLHDIQGGDA